MKLHIFGLVFLLAAASSFASQARAQSAFIVDILQEGNNVVANGSGVIKLDGLEPEASEPFSPPGSIDPQSADIFIFGSPSTPIIYINVSGPSSFGPGGSSTATTSSGTFAGIGGGGTNLFLTSGAAGLSISNSATWDNTTISNLGITPGTYTWSWDGGQETYTLSVVPEPSQYGLFVLLALCGLIGWRRFVVRRTA